MMTSKVKQDDKQFYKMTSSFTLSKQKQKHPISTSNLKPRGSITHPPPVSMRTGGRSDEE